MKYQVGYKDKDGSFLLCNTFDTYKEAEYHREMWQDTEDQWLASGMYLDGDYYGEDEYFPDEYIIRICK